MAVFLSDQGCPVFFRRNVSHFQGGVKTKNVPLLEGGRDWEGPSQHVSSAQLRVVVQFGFSGP